MLQTTFITTTRVTDVILHQVLISVTSFCTFVGTANSRPSDEQPSSTDRQTLWCYEIFCSVWTGQHCQHFLCFFFLDVEINVADHYWRYWNIALMLSVYFCTFLQWILKLHKHPKNFVCSLKLVENCQLLLPIITISWHLGERTLQVKRSHTVENISFPPCSLIDCVYPSWKD